MNKITVRTGGYSDDEYVRSLQAAKAALKSESPGKGSLYNVRRLARLIRVEWGLTHKETKAERRARNAALDPAHR